MLPGSGVLTWQVSAVCITSSWTWFPCAYSSCNALWRAVPRDQQLPWLGQFCSRVPPASSCSAHSFSGAWLLHCMAANRAHCSAAPLAPQFGQFCSRMPPQKPLMNSFPWHIEGRFLASFREKNSSEFCCYSTTETYFHLRATGVPSPKILNLISTNEAFHWSSHCSLYLLFLHSSEFTLLLISQFPQYFNLLLY